MSLNMANRTWSGMYWPADPGPAGAAFTFKRGERADEVVYEMGGWCSNLISPGYLIVIDESWWGDKFSGGCTPTMYPFLLCPVCVKVLTVQVVGSRSLLQWEHFFAHGALDRVGVLVLRQQHCPLLSLFCLLKAPTVQRTSAVWRLGVQSAVYAGSRVTDLLQNQHFTTRRQHCLTCWFTGGCSSLMPL